MTYMYIGLPIDAAAKQTKQTTIQSGPARGPEGDWPGFRTGRVAPN